MSTDLDKVSSDAASSVNILEQGLTLDQLAQEKSGRKQPQPTAGESGRNDLAPSSEFSNADRREQGV